MKKIILFTTIIISFCYCTIDYQPNYSILNNSKDINLNISSWGWYDTKNNDSFDLTELWMYATYYSNKHYVLEGRYSYCSDCDAENTDALGINIYYYNNFHTNWISKVGLNYDSRITTNIFHILTYDYFFDEFMLMNFFLGQEYGFESEKTHNTLSLTLQMNSLFSPYFSVWIKDDYNDNNIWVGIGINILFKINK